MRISVVSPVYKAKSIIPELVIRLSSALTKITDDFEIILVDDRCPDNSWHAILEQSSKQAFVKGIRLSRNFGQHNAITAGISKATGDCIVLMDCDLQDDPIHIEEMMQQIKAGFNIVFTKRINRKHSFIKRWSTKIYNDLFRLIADKNFDIRVGSLVVFERKVAREYLKLKEQDKLYVQALKWLGYSTTILEVEHRDRYEGKSSYTIKKLASMALQGLVSNSERLLYLSIKMGLGFSFLSIVFILYIVYKTFTQEFLPGWPSMISALFLCTGILLICLGILGVYIGKIIKEVRQRPNYIIDEEINF